MRIGGVEFARRPLFHSLVEAHNPPHLACLFEADVALDAMRKLVWPIIGSLGCLDNAEDLLGSGCFIFQLSNI